MIFNPIQKRLRPVFVCAIASTAALLAVSSSHGAGRVIIPGHLVVSRAVYSGTANTVPFPGILVNNAASVADGVYPDVFNNENPDASFGVTAPIYLDTMSTQGVVVKSFNVTQEVGVQLGRNIATSFSSKSEVALNLTLEGDAVTFIAYAAAPNQLDISNANTPGHIDMSNLAVNAPSTQRVVIEVDALGHAEVTATNAYSGNNGRAVIGADGNYYMAGNAGNNGKSVTFASGTVSIANGSNAVALSGASSTANMHFGTPFSGMNIPAGTYVTAINSPTSFTISANATGTASGSYVANEAALQLPGFSVSAGSNMATIGTGAGGTANMAVSMRITGTGIPSGTYVSSIISLTQFTISANATANSSGNYTAGVPLSMLSDNTGVQMIAKGASGESTVVGQVNGTYGSDTGYQRGFAGSPSDKTGKVNNYRGLTLNRFNNTLYVSKGSGSNGVNSVYQVGAGGLPTLASAGTTPFSILPGFPTTGTTTHPFGLWFADANTLYVADEGSGSVSDPNAGLQKWAFNGSVWVKRYTLQANLIGNSYNVTGGGTTITPTVVGLRNIAGRANRDGTVTVFGTTSTTSDLTDVGADPNQLVSVTDLPSATTLPDSEAFTTLRTAEYGEVLRGVAFAPIP
jgi:hypothetical protein